VSPRPRLDLVDAAGIAEQLRVSRRTAWRYLGRADFPPPVVEVSGKRLWDRREVERWANRTLPLPEGRPTSGRKRGAS